MQEKLCGISVRPSIRLLMVERTQYRASKSHWSASMTSGVLYAEVKGALWAYLLVLDELTLKRGTLFKRNTWTPHLKHLQLLVCFGTVAKVHLCIYLSTSRRRV